MSAPRASARGFTLVEVMVAATFFLVSLAGIVVGLGAATDMYEHQRHMTTALALSESVMEELQLLPSGSDQIDSGSHVACYTSTGDEVPNCTGSYTYTATWVVAGGVPIDGMREVRLTLSWTEKSGSRSLSLRTVRP